MTPMLDCYITPGMLAVIVVVVVASVVIAYLIGTACVRSWIKKSPTYTYCARCNQFLGSVNVGRPPHLVPGFHGPSYNRIDHNDFHGVPNIRVNVSEHDDRPPTGTFQRLGMKTSKSNHSSTFPNFWSPVQASPPDKITTTSEMELLTPVPEALSAEYVNQPGAVLSKPSTPNDPSSATRTGSLIKKTQQSSGKVGPPLSGATNTEMLSQVEQETSCVSGDDSVFYKEEGGDCRHRREVSKMSQVRILASPPHIGASKLHGALISTTPANANKSYRNVESSSCQPQTVGQSKIKNRFRSSLRDKGQARRSVQSEGSGKSRLSLMSRKLKLFSDDRKPRNSPDTQYSPLVSQNPTTVEDSCGIRSDFNPDSISKNGDTRENALVQEKSPNQLEIDRQEGQVVNPSFIQEGDVLKTDSLDYPNELRNEMRLAGNKITESEAKKVLKRGSPGNTGNISIPHLLVNIDIDGSPQQMSPEFVGDHCKVGACSSHESNDVIRIQKGESLVRNEMLKDGHVMEKAAPSGQDLGTKPKVRSSTSARQEKAQYLGKRPGFTESDITSQSEDERPRSRLASLRRKHLAGMSQFEEDEKTSRKERDNLPSLETPSHTPQYPVQTSKYVTTKRGTPAPSSLPMCTPKFVTVRERNIAPDTSNYPPNSWDSKNSSNFPPNSWDSKNSSNFPPNSWDPANQDFVKNKPLDLSDSSGQINHSINSYINNLSVTAMDNSTPAEGNHTSSPHSSAHRASFKPEDLSIPGLDASLSLQQQSPSQEGLTRARPAHTVSSPPLVQDGRYSHPLSNPMRQPLALPNTAQNQSPQVLTPDMYNKNSHGFLGKDPEKLGSSNLLGNLASKNDTGYPTEMLDNLDNSTGSVSSQNQLLKLNHDSSKGSQDTSRGVSLDSTSTLVPSPVNPNNRPQPEAFATCTPVVSKSSPSPQHSLIPRPIERNHQTRSMPPVTQWSRVQEHALPPSLPPLAPKTRIDVVVPSNAPVQSLQSPAEHIQESRTHTTNIRTQNVRSMPPAPQWSRGKEHALRPPTPTNTGSNNLTDPPIDLLTQNLQPDALLQPMRSMPPAPHWSRVKEHALPPSLPPSAPKTRIPGFGIQRDFDSDARDHMMGVVPEERNASASTISRENSRSSSASGVASVPRSLVASGPRSPVASEPVRSTTLQPSRSQSAAGQPNSRVDSRSRSTTESSHPPSLIWDSYGSDPSLVPRRPEDLEDFTLSSESESNKMMRKGHHVVYRSDGESVQNGDIKRQSRPLVETTKENQISLNSKYFQAGVRTRSQSR